MPGLQCDPDKIMSAGRTRAITDRARFVKTLRCTRSHIGDDSTSRARLEEFHNDFERASMRRRIRARATDHLRSRNRRANIGNYRGQVKRARGSA